MEYYYTGGGLAYGYKYIRTGRTNKRKQEVNDLALREDEAGIVRIMFALYLRLTLPPSFSRSTKRSAAAMLGRSAPSLLFMVRFGIFCCRQDFPPPFQGNAGANVCQ